MKGFAGTSYDEVPYMAASFSNTHPEILAVTALLRGLDPPPLAGARVLELGCARGANLVPMATSLPGAEFVGVDLSARQIEEARETAAAVGAPNVTFHAMDLRDLDESFGSFDYVVGHGLYSWVPPEVQEAILEVCARRLSPNGIVYLSYNTFPGWHVSVMFRDMMLYRIRKISDPQERLREARGFMRFLADSAKPAESLWAVLLKEQADYVDQATDWYLLHDDLETENNPVYFSEMVERAARHGLQYVTEERWGTPDEVLSPEVWKILDRFATDRVEREQYLDFLRNGRFRRSLFCHAGLQIASGPVPDRLERCRFRTRVRPVDPAADPLAPGEEAFVGEGGLSLTTGDMRLRTLLHVLYDVWPGTLDFAATTHILAEAVRRTAGGEAPPTHALARMLQQALLAQLVSTHLLNVPIATEAPERPRATPVARHQALRGDLVTNLFHQSLDLEPLDRVVLPLLDGTRTMNDLEAAVAAAVADGRLAATSTGRPPEEPEAPKGAGELAALSVKRILASCYILG
ncbi:MAG: class I SAM-dependent methyltransferase [Thermoanaerobaculia bacterium]